MFLTSMRRQMIKEIIVETFMNRDILRGMLQPFAASVEAFQLNFEKNGIIFFRNLKAVIRR